MKIAKPNLNPAPKHLGKRAKEFWRQLDAELEFTTADRERLLVCCQCLDAIDQADAEIRKHGMFDRDRYGSARTNPAVIVSRDARALLLRSLRELSIDIEVPEQPRIPHQARRYG